MNCAEPLGKQSAQVGGLGQGRQLVTGHLRQQVAPRDVFVCESGPVRLGVGCHERGDARAVHEDDDSKRAALESIDHRNQA